MRYEGVADTTADPTTTTSIPNNCHDAGLASMTPWVKRDVGTAIDEGNLHLGWYFDIPSGLIYHWTINAQALEVDWAQPTLKLIENGNFSYPKDYSVKEVTTANEV